MLQNESALARGRARRRRARGASYVADCWPPGASGQLSSVIVSLVYPGDRELLDQAMHGSGVHSWVIDLGTREIELAGASNERTGMPMMFGADLGLAHVHVDDRPALRAAVADALGGRNQFVVDHRFIHPVSGAEAWYRERGVVVRDAGG